MGVGYYYRKGVGGQYRNGVPTHNKYVGRCAQVGTAYTVGYLGGQ